MLSVFSVINVQQISLQPWSYFYCLPPRPSSTLVLTFHLYSIPTWLFTDYRKPLHFAQPKMCDFYTIRLSCILNYSNIENFPTNHLNECIQLVRIYLHRTYKTHKQKISQIHQTLQHYVSVIVIIELVPIQGNI